MSGLLFVVLWLGAGLIALGLRAARGDNGKKKRTPVGNSLFVLFGGLSLIGMGLVLSNDLYYNVSRQRSPLDCDCDCDCLDDLADCDCDSNSPDCSSPDCNCDCDSGDCDCDCNCD